jgi:hypothetical protein
MGRKRVWIVYETRRGGIQRVFMKPPDKVYPGYIPPPGQVVLDITITAAEYERIWQRKVRDGRLVQKEV